MTAIRARTKRKKEAGWVPVIYADQLPGCELCGEPWCDKCKKHYADCDCPGPHSEDFEFKEVDGVLLARKLSLQAS